MLLDVSCVRAQKHDHLRRSRICVVRYSPNCERFIFTNNLYASSLEIHNVYFLSGLESYIVCLLQNIIFPFLNSFNLTLIIRAHT